MSRVYRVLIAVSWGLGLLSLVAGVVLRLAPALAQRTNVYARGGLIFSPALAGPSLSPVGPGSTRPASRPAEFRKSLRNHEFTAALIWRTG